MRDCVFLVADGNMRACVEGFFGRPQSHQRLGTGSFDFDPDQDLFVDEGGNDPGVYKRSHEILKPFLKKHQRAVVILDSEWDGSPGAVQIATDIQNNLVFTGWSPDRIAVIVIDPELDVWIWQDNPHIDRAFRHQGPPSLRQVLAQDGSWPARQAKPDRPKELIERILKQKQVPRSSALYRDICSRVSVRQCADPAFLALRNRLHTWFPREAGA